MPQVTQASKVWGEVPLPEDLEAEKDAQASRSLLDDDEDFAADEASGGELGRNWQKQLPFIRGSFISPDAFLRLLTVPEDDNRGPLLSLRISFVLNTDFRDSRFSAGSSSLQQLSCCTGHMSEQKHVLRCP